MINPAAGSKYPSDLVKELVAGLLHRGKEVVVEKITSLEHAASIAASAIGSEQYAALVVIGGDGTLRAVASQAVNRSVPLLAIPGGTANLLAHELGIEKTARSALAAIDAEKIRTIDVGRINGTLFASVLGVGFDAEVIKRINRIRRGHTTYFRCLPSVLEALRQKPFPRLKVWLDGQLACDQRSMLLVGNVSRYAARLRIHPQAVCDDGKLDACIVKGRTVGRCAAFWGSIAIGIYQQPWILRRRCRSIDVTSLDPEVAVQVDGEPGPTLPVHINISSKCLSVLVPAMQEN